MVLFAIIAFLAVQLLFSGAAFAQVEIQLRNTATTQDDYLCWSPTLARARLTSAAGAGFDVKITSQSLNTGAVAFAAFSGTSPTRSSYQPADQISLSLPASGDWVPFLVSGKTASTLTSSVPDKDVKIIAHRASDNTEVGSLQVMVRVRKNATQLTVKERDLFLETLAQLHGHRRGVGPSNAYMKYATAHANAFSFGIHSADQGLPLFLAWHRAFLLSLERELQAIDPRVALPYWRFDQPMATLFSQAFMGQTNVPNVSDPHLVRFAGTNPLNGWYTRADGELRRVRNGAAPLQTIRAVDIGLQAPASVMLIDELSHIFPQSGADLYGGPLPGRGINARFEFRYHNLSHAFIDGWLGSGDSPRDPLFFLLHANVDRAWAEWQARFDRFDRNDTSAYPAQGAYPGPGGLNDPQRLPKSSYAIDPMWPWSQDDGGSTATDPGDDWPDVGFPFPAGLPGTGPAAAPSPGDMIDYMNALGRSESLGMCYDHIVFLAR